MNLPFSYLFASAVFTLPIALVDAVNEQTLMPLGVAVTCCIFIGRLLWRAGQTLQNIDDRLTAIEKFQEKLPCKELCETGSHRLRK